MVEMECGSDRMKLRGAAELRRQRWSFNAEQDILLKRAELLFGAIKTFNVLFSQ